MKKLLILLLALILALPCTVSGESASQVVTSFYPIYIFALNVFDGIEEISVECMTAPQTGCLHDYQLVVSDMMKLADSDMLIVCGAGMENYLADITLQFPQLPVVDCSAGIELIEECKDEHDHGDHEHHVNPHTWLDVQNAVMIVDTIAEAAKQQFPEVASKIEENSAAYKQRLTALDAEFAQQLQEFAGRKIITFHEAFPYFAKAYGLEIAAVVTQEHDEALSPAEIAKVIQTVVQNDLPPLFTEPQYASTAAMTVAMETGAKIYELDPIVTGDRLLTAYENGMRRNLNTLLEAFQ